MARAEAVEPEIIHHDADLLVLHKPPGLPTSAPVASDPSLVRWVSERFPELRAHATSRLDSQVSGVVTFALNREANQHLLDARKSGTYERIYLGITVHELADDAGRWDWPISIDPRDPKHRRAGAGRGERHAMTRYEVAARRSGATLLRLMPATGRTHQLRVHAAEAGAPLFGDPAYGGERRAVLPDGAVVTARRVMLHCARVSFPSLSGPERIVIEAAVRPDMQRVWQAFGGAASELQP
ncbi:MAG TPA: RluA family pseudouridine synthase [Polyangiales bacterium]|nr:RluA family pseudouridine synthase [Polyangiales bacterium]